MNERADNSAKGQLARLCSEKGYGQPSYTTSEPKGQKRVYGSRVTVDQNGKMQSAPGKGSSSSAADQNAANALIKKLCREPMPSGRRQPRDAITLLHEHCARKKYPKPNFRYTEKEEGGSVEYTYRCAQEAAGQSIIGEGTNTNMSQAKRESANSVLTQLQQLHL